MKLNFLLVAGLLLSISALYGDYFTGKYPSEMTEAEKRAHEEALRKSSQEQSERFRKQFAAKK